MSTTALLILDGFGIGENDPKSNAIVAAGTPVIDRLKETYCHTAIGASGLDVGLPDGTALRRVFATDEGGFTEKELPAGRVHGGMLWLTLPAHSACILLPEQA